MFGDDDLAVVEGIEFKGEITVAADKKELNRKVYVSNFSNYEFHGAAKYGTIHYLTAGTVNLARPAALIKKILPKIKQSDPEDYLVLSGASVLCAIVFNTWMQYHGKVNLLVYYRKRDAYVKACLGAEDFPASAK